MDRQEALDALNSLNDEGEEQGSTEQDIYADLPEPGAFWRGDPNSLPDEARAIYNEMNAGLQRKFREIAAERQQYEALQQYQEQFGGLENVTQALDWVQDFANNPQRQLEVYNALSEHLQQQGYTKPVADAAAAQAVTEQVEESGEDDFEFGYDPRVDELENELTQLRDWVSQQQYNQQYQQIDYQLSQQEQAIRQANPNYADEDIDAIYRLAHSTEGNMFAAQEIYEDNRQRWAYSMMNQKQGVPTGVRPAPPGTQHAEQPQSFESIDDPAIRQQALARLRLIPEFQQ